VGIGEWPGQRELNERLRALVEEQQITSACVTCGEIVAVAPLQEARAAFRAHVEKFHPEIVPALNVKRLPRVAPDKSQKKEPDYELLRRLELIAAAA